MIGDYHTLNLRTQGKKFICERIGFVEENDISTTVTVSQVVLEYREVKIINRATISRRS